MTPEAARRIGRITLRRALGRVLFCLVPGAARRRRLVRDFTFRNARDALALPCAVNQGRLPDFSAPRTLSDKVCWTWLHHHDPQMALGTDKITLRRDPAPKAAQIAPPRPLATGWNPAGILRRDRRGTGTAPRGA